MKLSKQRKMVIAVLALALLALAVDQVFLGGDGTSPQPAAGASASPIAPVDLGQPAAPVAMALPIGDSLGVRLKKLSAMRGIKVDGVRDAFRPSEAWKPTSKPEVHTDKPVYRRPNFAAEHLLMAVMGSGLAGVAIVDGKCFKMGRKLDGYTLTAVGERTATFQCDTHRVTLELPKPKMPEE